MMWVRLASLACAVLVMPSCGVAVRTTPAPLSAAPPRCVAVLPFENSSEHAHAGLIVATLVAETLLQGGFGVLDPQEALAHAPDALAGTRDPRALARLGELLGVDAVLVGSVTRYAGSATQPNKSAPVEIAYSARLIDTREKRVIWANSVSATDRPYLLALPRSRVQVTREAVEETLRELTRHRRSKELSGAPCWRTGTDAAGGTP